MSDIETEHRHLKWKFKLLAKQAGRQGATIYALRNENAALREAVGWNPGDRARLFAQVRELSVQYRKVAEENSRLREVLKAHEDVIVAQPPRLISRDETVTRIKVEQAVSL